jgi:hypothetical protein
MNRSSAVRLDRHDMPAVATSMVVVLTYWLNYEYVRDPRKALEPEQSGATLARGAWHVLSLVTPYLEPAARAHLQALAGGYRSENLTRSAQRDSNEETPAWPDGPSFPTTLQTTATTPRR